MTAREWLEKHFPIYDGYFSAMQHYMASADYFVEVFGARLESALQNGTSTYDALMATPGGTRGWELYFEDWKRRGILS